MMKKITTTVGILLLVSVLAVPVFAWHRGGWDDSSRGPGYCGQGGRTFGSTTEEQRNQLDKLEQKFYDDTRGLRTQMWIKSDELDALLNTSEPDRKKVKALQEEISSLRGKMAQKRIDSDLEARNIAPNSGFARGGHGKGYGRHMRGYGPRAGYGPGSCW